MPIIATFELIFLVAKVDVVGPNPIARSNNKRRLPKGSLFFVIRSGGMRSHEKVGPTRTRGGRKYADEVKPSEDAAATPIPLRRQTIYYLKTLSYPNISLIFEICFFATLLYRGKIFYHRFLYNDEKNMSQRKK